MIFSREFLTEELDLPYSNVVESKIIDRSRWSLIYEIIFEYNGKYYRTYYSTGATEYQDESPWEDEEEIECEEVERKEITIQAWMSVEDNNKDDDETIVWFGDEE